MQNGILLRAGIPAKLLQYGSGEEIREATLKVLRICAHGGRFIMGCGIVPFEVDPTTVLKFKEIALSFKDF